MIKRWFRKHRFSNTYKTVVANYLGCHFTLREMSASERLAFSEFVQDENHNDMMVAGWVLSRVCAEFVGRKIDEIVTEISPSALGFLLEKALEVSEIGQQALEEEEKKSESSPNTNSPSK